jgi:hypothetical protein
MILLSILKKATLPCLAVLAAQSAFGGGSSIGPQFDATVTCSGNNGYLIFNVMRDTYRGQLLSLDSVGTGHIAITNSESLDHLLASDVLKKSNWDRRRFIESLGQDPSAFKRNISGQTLRTGKDSFLLQTLSGGSLDELYTPTHALHAHRIEIDRTDSRQLQQKRTQVKVEQLSATTYVVKVDLLTSGQKQCLATRLEPNPWASIANVPKFIEVCTRYMDLTDQTTTTVAETMIEVKTCKLN